MTDSQDSPQLIIMTRLAEFCRYHEKPSISGEDSWNFMRRKLLETEPPLRQLKTAMYVEARTKLIAAMNSGKFDAERCADFKLLFEKLLSPGDFADLAIHLAPGTAPERIHWVARLLWEMRPMDCFAEERKPAAERGPAWEKLVQSLYERLDFLRLDQLRQRKPATARRTTLLLRRVRRNVAHYCAVVRIPTTTEETFTPFMLTRIEAVIAAGLRFLKN